jgi:hypothetical protein
VYVQAFKLILATFAKIAGLDRVDRALINVADKALLSKGFE